MRTPLLVTVTFLAGCASTADCGPDWRSIGQRDGRMNAGSQAQGYAARCPGPVDRAAYEEGYSLGFSERPRISAF
jgi:hypothetical protein